MTQWQFACFASLRIFSTFGSTAVFHGRRYYPKNRQTCASKESTSSAAGSNRRFSLRLHFKIELPTSVFTFIIINLNFQLLTYFEFFFIRFVVSVFLFLYLNLHLQLFFNFADNCLYTDSLSMRRTTKCRNLSGTSSTRILSRRAIRTHLSISLTASTLWG